MNRQTEIGEGKSEEKKEEDIDAVESRFWGQVPEDWRLVKGNKIYDVNPSYNPKEEKITYIEMDALDTELPYPNYSDYRDPNEHSGRLFQEGDVIFPRITPCTENGKNALIPEINTKIGIGSTEFIVLSPNRERIIPWYLYYLTKSHPVRDYAISRMRGSTGRQRVPYSVFRKELDVTLPPLSEQEKIASVLYNVDRAIQKTEEIIEQAKRVKKGVMQDLFTEGYYEHKIEKRRIGSKIRKIPVTWDTARLGELADYQNGYGFDKDQWRDKGRLIIRIQDLTSPEDSDRNYFQGDIDPKYEVEDGDILVSWSATLGVFQWDRGDAVLNQHIFKVRNIKEHVVKQFLYHLLVYSLNELERKIHGTTMKHVTRSAFEGTEVPLPDLEEQKKISDFLDNLENKLKVEKKHLDLLNSFKKGLMQDLLTGKVRTKDKPIEVLPEVKAHG